MTSEPGRPPLATPALRWKGWGAVTHPESGAECSAAVSRLVGRVEVPSRPGQRTRRPRALARMDAMARRECGNGAASPRPGPLAMIGATARRECGGASPHPGHRLFPPARMGVVARRECGNGAATQDSGNRTRRSRLLVRMGAMVCGKCEGGGVFPRPGHRSWRASLFAMGAAARGEFGGGAGSPRLGHLLRHSRPFVRVGAMAQVDPGGRTSRMKAEQKVLRDER